MSLLVARYYNGSQEALPRLDIETRRVASFDLVSSYVSVSQCDVKSLRIFSRTTPSYGPKGQTVTPKMNTIGIGGIQ